MMPKQEAKRLSNVFNLDESFEKHCQAAINYFSSCSDSSDIKLRRHPEEGSSPYSFIKIEGCIYVIARGILGEGHFGRVKFAMRVEPKDSTRLYALKVETKNKECFKLQTQVQDDEIINWLRMSGFLIGSAVRESPESSLYKHYSVMPYTGEALINRLRREQKVQDEMQLEALKDERLKMAIDLCLCVEQLHYVSHITHGDIKPANITVDENGHVSFIDFDSALPDTVKMAEGFKGSFAYSPFPGRYPDGDYLAWISNIKTLGCIGGDLFALERVLRSSTSPNPVSPASPASPTVDPEIPCILDKRLFPHLPPDLDAMLDTTDVTEASERERLPHYTLYLAAHLIAWYANMPLKKGQEARMVEMYKSLTQEMNEQTLRKADGFSQMEELRQNKSFHEACTQASAYFSEYPSEVKTHSSHHQSNARYSFLKTENGQIYYKTRQEIGKGAYGKVKLATLIEQGTDRPSNPYVIKKIESEDQVDLDARLFHEEQFSRRYGFFSGKLRRVSKKGTVKGYLVFPYQGENLSTWLKSEKGSLSSIEDLLRLAIAICLKVNRLHNIDGFAHGDLKLNNITIDFQKKVHLIDFGTARDLDASVIIQGSWSYLPTDMEEPQEMNDKVLQPLLNNMKRLGLRGVDTFALKRVISSILNKVAHLLPQALWSMLDTSNLEQAILRKDTPFTIALSLICYMTEITQHHLRTSASVPWLETPPTRRMIPPDTQVTPVAGEVSYQRRGGEKSLGCEETSHDEVVRQLSFS